MENFHVFQNRVKQLQSEFQKQSKVRRIVFISLLSGISAIFQSAGGFFPGIGYLISPLATAPILLCTVFSPSFGFYAYLLTLLQLLILQPSELIIFPFTTGILGISIGVPIHHLKNRWGILLFGAIGLTAGICLLLYGLKFPVLGPAISNSISIPVIGGIFAFSLLYSILWLFISKLILKKFKFHILP